MSSLKRKTVKRIFGDCMTILTVIVIFSFSVSCIGFILFTFISSPASAATEESAADKFQEAMRYANSFKDVVQTEKTEEGNINLKVNSYKLEPGETFMDPKTQKSWYTNNPTQSNYYNQGNAHGMEKEAIAETTKDESYQDANGNPVPTPGKLVTTSFTSRPIAKIGQNEEFMQKGKIVTDNANNIIGGESNKYINCEKQKMSACKTIHVEKTCNEEVRTIRRICEKVPSITTYVKDFVYPNCQSLIITQHVNTHCPSGYGEVFGTDMVHTEDNHWDDIRFCTKPADGLECYSGGYYVERAVDSNFGSGVATVPKKLHARIRISNVYFNPVKVTVINDTTGATICNNSDYGSGGVIDLPYSDTQDQTFRFYATQNSCRGWFCRRDTGVLVLYIDRMAKEKIANKPIWKESCRDV